jgi:RNA polymerase sigma-70 factor (ECF subfamily)
MNFVSKAVNVVALSVEQREKVVRDTAARLLNRARNNRGLCGADLQPRIAATLEKYLLRDEPEAGEQKIRDFLESLQIDDLCLVVACERGNDVAWQDLFANFSGAVKSAARSVTSNQDAAEDLAQSIWAELHGLKIDSAGKPTGKLGYYSGRGSLAGWLRAVVSQLAIDAHRKQSRLVQIEEPREFENLAYESERDEKSIFARTENPESAFAMRETARAIEETLIKVLAELDAEDRLLIKLYYFDGLRLKQAGAVLGFHEATASRRLTRIHGELRKRVEKILIREKGWTPDEIERNLAEAGEKLDTNLEKLIASVPNVQEN